MFHWNHRVVVERNDGKWLDRGPYWYSVREVFYNNDNTIYAYTENACQAGGDSIEELREYLEWMLAALDKEPLIDGEVEFVDFYLGDDEDTD